MTKSAALHGLQAIAGNLEDDSVLATTVNIMELRAQIEPLLNTLAEEYAALESSHAELVETLREARRTIEIWHGEVGLAEYQQAPEMRRIDTALANAAKLKGGSNE